jgi:hypothetical protein
MVIYGKKIRITAANSIARTGGAAVPAPRRGTSISPQRRRGRQTNCKIGFGSHHILVYSKIDNIGCKCKDPKPIAESGQQASTSTL